MRPMRTLAAILAAACLCGASLHAQQPDVEDAWRWVRFEATSGLPSERIVDIVVAADGVVWASTDAGFAWFDGSRWRPVPLPAGFPKAIVTFVVADRARGLLAVADGRLYRGDTSGFRAIPLIRNDLPLTVGEVAALSDGTLLVESDRRLYRYVAGRLSNDSTYPGAPAANLWGLRRTARGTIWLASQLGLHRWDGKGWAKVPMLRPHRPLLGEDSTGRLVLSSIEPFEQRGLWQWMDGRTPSAVSRGPYDLITQLAVAPNGDVVVAYGGELFLRPKGGEELRPLSDQIGSPTALAFTATGDLWIGTSDGLWLWRRSSRLWATWKRPGFDQRNRINEVLRARDGLLWIATADGLEVRRADGTLVRTLTSIAERPLGSVTGLAEDDAGSIWIASGSSFDGAYRWRDNEWRHFGVREGLRAERIHKIRRDRRGRLWFLGLAAHRNGRAAGEEPGAFVLENGTFSRWGVPEGLPSGRVYAFAEGGDGALWFGTYGGVSRWKAGRWTHWTGIDRRAFTLAVGPDGRVWFGDPMRGLAYIDSLDRVQRAPEVEARVGRDVWDMRVDRTGRLWVSTWGQLLTYAHGVWASLDRQSGLANTQLWPVLPLDDRVYIGTMGGGLTVLALDEPQVQPTVAILHVDTRVHYASVLWHLAAPAGWFNGDALLTRHRWDGGAWSPWQSQRLAVYAEPSAGRHTFEVQAKGFLGALGPLERISFTVPAPLLLRPPVLGGMGLVLLVVGGLARLLVVRGRSARRSLRDRDELVAMSQRSGAVGSWEWDPVVKVARLSAEARRLVEIPPAAPENLYDLFRGFIAGAAGTGSGVHPDDRENIRRQLVALAVDGAPLQCDVRLTTTDGTARVVRVETTHSRAADASSSVIRGVVRDVTDTVEAERAQRTLRDLALRLAGAGDLQTMVSLALDAALDVSRCTAGGVYLVNERSGALDLVIHRGLPPASAAKLSHFEATDELSGLVRAGRPCDLHHPDGTAASVYAPPSDCRFVALFPMEANGGIVGGLFVASQTTSVLSRRQRDHLEAVAATTAGALARQRTSDALRAAEARFRVVFERAPGGIALIDTATGRYMEANEQYCRIVGRSREELLASDVPSVTHPDDMAESLRVRRRLQSGASRLETFEKRYVHPDGTVTWGHVMVVPLWDSGEPPGVHLALVEDITERRAAQAALAESEEKFRTLAEQSPSMISITNEGRVLYANAACEAVTGYARTELMAPAFSLFTLLDEESRALVQSVRQRHAEGANIPPFEVRLRTKDGRQLNVISSSRLIPFNGGTALLNVATDITEHKRVEEELRESKQLLTEAQHVAQIGSWELDLGSDTLTWSDEVFRIFEVAPAQFGSLYDSFLQLVHPDDRELVDRTYAASLRGKVPYSVEHRLRFPDGRIKWVHERGETHFDDTGRPVRSVGTVQDITGRKLSELRVQDLQQELRALAKHLDAVREDERARLAQDLHDELGQALTAIKMDLRTMRQRAQARRAPSLASLDEMGRLLDRSIEVGRRVVAQLRPPVLDGLSFADSLRWQADEFARRHHIACTVVCEPEHLAVPADALLPLFRIVQEALTNVARHADARRVTITVRAAEGTLALSVEDDGQGFVADAASRPRTFGILGMRERALALGGSFNAHTKTDGGAKVHVLIPMPQPAQDRSAP